jgi:hypothetical protein
MFKMLLKYSFPVFIILLAVGCNSGDEPLKKAVAEVGDNKLYLSEISSVIPPEAESEDSILMADDYIKKWVKRELLLQKAEENLTAEQKNVSEQLEEYRKSLMLYKYKNAIMSQRMDTTVTNQQVQEYYDANAEKFVLNNNIVKAVYIKIPNDLANPDQLKEMSKNNSTEGIIELRDYCLQYAKGFDIFIDNWVDFQLLTKNIPEPIENPEQFLQQNQMIERNDSDYYYLVTIYNYKLKNDQAPVEYVEEKIKNLIINRRKIDFLKQLENNVYSEGVKNNKFKIFKSERDDN